MPSMLDEPRRPQLYPAWSPDGKKIAFHHQEGKAEGGYYVMDADGDNLKEWLQA